LLDPLAGRFPEDTIVQFIYVPTIQAQLALSERAPEKAIKVLEAAAPYELGSSGNSAVFTSSLYIPSMYADKRIWHPIRAPRPQPSSRESSIGAALF
jgi:hypothetical protein